MVAHCYCPQAGFAVKGFNHEDVQYYSRRIVVLQKLC